MILQHFSASHVILLMVTSRRYNILHSRGLVTVPIWQGLRCQFHGDWSQRMASLTSECVSNTLVGEEMQHQLSHYFSSLYGQESRLSASTSACDAERQLEGFFWCSRVRVHFFCLLLFVNSLSSPVNGYSEGRWLWSKCGSSFVYSHYLRICVPIGFEFWGTYSCWSSFSEIIPISSVFKF